GVHGRTFPRTPGREGDARLDVRSGALPTRRGGKPHPSIIVSLVQLAANRAAREGGRVVVDVVGARVRAETGAGGARVRRRHAALLDVAGGPRRGRRRETRRHKPARAGRPRPRGAGGGVGGGAGADVLVFFVKDRVFELDGASLAPFNQRGAFGGGGRAGRFVLGRQLRVQDAHRAVTFLRRCPARGENRR